MTRPPNPWPPPPPGRGTALGTMRYITYRLFLAKLRLDLNGGTLGIWLRVALLLALCGALLAGALLAHPGPAPSVYPHGYRGRP